MVVCIVCGYFGWALNWKWQRKAFLTRPGIYPICGYGRIIRPPAVLRPLGEDGMEFVIVDTDYHDRSVYEQAKRLFPEAAVVFSPDDREGTVDIP